MQFKFFLKLKLVIYTILGIFIAAMIFLTYSKIREFESFKSIQEQSNSAAELTTQLERTNKNLERIAREICLNRLKEEPDAATRCQ